MKQNNNEKELYTAHDVAEILAEITNGGACDIAGNDEWLPNVCKLVESCPFIDNVACWEQYLKCRGRKDEILYDG